MTLAGKVAVVAGGSRGVGRGIAFGLAEAGATVYVTARGKTPNASDNTESLCETASQIQARGGYGVPIVCDHTHEPSVCRLFEEIWEEQHRLDILVFAVYPRFNFSRSYPTSISGHTPLKVPFWELPLAYWDELQIGSLRACYLTLLHAAPYFLRLNSGLIIVLSSQGSTSYSFNVPYGVDKAGVERLALDVAQDFAAFNIASIAIRPPLTRTEAVIEGARRKGLDLHGAYSPEYTGRTIAALAADPLITSFSGKAYDATELGRRYGIGDPITSD